MMRYSFVMPYALPVSFVVPCLSDAKIHKCHNQLQSEFQNNISLFFVCVHFSDNQAIMVLRRHMVHMTLRKRLFHGAEKPLSWSQTGSSAVRNRLSCKSGKTVQSCHTVFILLSSCRLSFPATSVACHQYAFSCLTGSVLRSES